MFYLSQLNDDCLRLIMDYLELEDQLILWQSTNPSTRLSCILCHKWQHKSRHLLNRQIFKSNPEVFKDFMLCISGKVEKLHLHNIPTYQLEQCRGYRYPHMRELDFEAYSFEDNDRDIENIVFFLFPMLTALKVKGKRSGQHIEHLRHINDLDLKECWQLEPQYFKRICSKLKIQKLSIQWKEKQERSYMEGMLKLQSLQELQLNMINLSEDQVDEIIHLPKLNKIRFPCDGNNDPIFKFAAELRGNDIHSVIFNNGIPKCITETCEYLQNVQQLTLIGISVKNIPSYFPNLKILNVVEKLSWHNGREFWHMVRDCPYLKTIFISKINIETFFNFDKALVDTVLRERVMRLKIYFHEIYGNRNLIHQHFQHFNLDVSFDKLTIETIDKFYIQMDFEPKE